MIDIIYRFNPARASGAALPADSTAAREVLERGNREFAELVVHGTAKGGHKTRIIPIDLRDIGWGGPEGGEPTQAPFAAVLACSDARVPTEMVFRCACNNLFVVRVAGNVLGTECLGSLRYATHHFAATLKLLVVLGHARCGAVTAAVDAYLAPRAYLELAANYPLRSVVDRILIAVRGGALALAASHGPLVDERPGYRQALTEISVVLNAAWTAYSLDREFRPFDGGPTAAFGIYDLASRKVWSPHAASSGEAEPPAGLMAAPDKPEAFTDLARAVASSLRVARLLDQA